jgi:hypothetical protein
MRIRETQPLAEDFADGVRSIVEIDGKTWWVDHPTEVTVDEVKAELLRQAKEHAVAEIDDACEQKRETLTARGAGKRDAYLLKYELVLRAIADPPDDTAKTLIATEAGARGLSFEQLANAIADRRGQWETAAMQIEAMEAAGKAAVAASPDRNAVSAAVATIRAGLASMGG